jgi:serine/threonine protein kinase
MLEPTVVGGRYRLLERIGAGAMGVVFLAEHIATGQVVAIKELLLPTGLDEATVRALRSRFALEREIGLVAAGHALLVPCIDYVDDAGREFIVMEHVSEGTTLREFILKQRRLAPSQVLRLFVQLASGVAFLHGCHFVCRDIKPSNIFVVRDASWVGGLRFRLADFGIGRDEHVSSDSRTRMMTVGYVGSPLFSAPEQYANETGAVTTATDVFQIAATVFFAATGEPVFSKSAGSRELELRHGAWRRDASAYRDDLPRSLTELLARCLAPDPAQRPRDAGALYRLLVSVAAASSIAVGQSPVRVAPGPTPTVLDRRDERRAFDGARWIFVSLAVATLITAAGLAALWIMVRQTAPR